MLGLASVAVMGYSLIDRLHSGGVGHCWRCPHNALLTAWQIATTEEKVRCRGLWHIGVTLFTAASTAGRPPAISAEHGTVLTNLCAGCLCGMPQRNVRAPERAEPSVSGETTQKCVLLR